MQFTKFTNCTSREPLFHDPYGSYGSYGSYGLYCPMQVTIVPRPVPPVNHCFTTCTGRTSRVKPFTGRICSTVLDKDDVFKQW